MRERLEAVSSIAAEPERTGIFVDFDGTLSAIVSRPEDARPVPGAVEVLERLASRFALVAVVSGRSLDDLRALIPVRGVLLAGSYGRERSDRPAKAVKESFGDVAEAAGAAVAELTGVRVERKASGVALHFRAAPELTDDVRQVAEELAGAFGLDVKPGRMVFELLPPGPGKGDAMIALIDERNLTHVLAAGDDWGDLEAFVKLRERDDDIDAVIVAVVSAEGPPALIEHADIVVNDPSELVGLLQELAGQNSGA